MSREEQMYQDVADIKECLVGNPLKNNPGLVNTVNGLDDKVGIIENRIITLEEKKKSKRTIKLPSWIIKLFSL